MKKRIAYITSALLGILIGIIVHCSLMITQAQGLLMIPTIEPNQHVVISMLDKDIEAGDVIAIRPPYYTVDGEGNIIFRRVVGVDEMGVTLTCDANTTKERIITIPRDNVLGKVLGVE